MGADSRPLRGGLRRGPGSEYGARLHAHGCGGPAASPDAPVTLRAGPGPPGPGRPLPLSRVFRPHRPVRGPGTQVCALAAPGRHVGDPDSSPVTLGPAGAAAPPHPPHGQSEPAGRGSSRPFPLPGRGAWLVRAPPPTAGPAVYSASVHLSVSPCSSVRPERAAAASAGRGCSRVQCTPRCPARETSRGGAGSRVRAKSGVRAGGGPGPPSSRASVSPPAPLEDGGGCVGWDGAQGRDALIRPLATVGIRGCGFSAQLRTLSFPPAGIGGGRR